MANNAKFTFKPGTENKQIGNLKYKVGDKSFTYEGKLQDAPDEAIEALIAEGSNLVKLAETKATTKPVADKS